MATPGLLRAHADFRRLWIGDAVSKLGGGVVLVALPVLAATVLDAATWQVALLATFASLPYLVIGLPVGAWVDRMRRRPVLVAAASGRAVALSWVPVGALLGVLTVEQLYLVQLLVGVGTACFDIAEGAYLPTLVGRDRLVQANGALAASRTVAFAASPTVGGQLVQWLGAPLGVLATVFGYLWSAVWVASIRAREPAPAVPERRSLAREIGEGMRFVLTHPFIRATVLFATTAVLCLGTRYAIEVLFLLRTVGLSPAAIGALMAVAGTGAVAGAATANPLARALGRIRTVLVSGPGMGVGGLLVPMTTPGAGVVWYAAGAGLVAYWITVNIVVSESLRQLLCPDHLLGRMNATSRFLAWASLPLGGVIGGGLGTWLGLRATLWLAAAGVLASTLWLLLSPACRTRDLPPETRPRWERATPAGPYT